MANSLTKSNFNDAKVQYESNGTQITLSPSTVKAYLTSGNGAVTDQEVVMFINLCKAQRLNPYLREAYLIKYGSQPATIVTGKEVFTKRAQRNKSYSGFEAGVIVQKEDDTLEYRDGSLVLKDETLVGGYARIYIKEYKVPLYNTVSFSEYCQTKDGKPMSNWATKPATMIRKVALVQALREAFPEDFQGLYDQSEVYIETVPEQPVTPPEPQEHNEDPLE